MNPGDLPIADKKPRRFRFRLREVFMQLFLVALAMFAGYSLRVSPDFVLFRDANLNRIELTEDDIHQLYIDWASGAGHRPSETDKRRLVDEKIREEVFYREALALGLDKEDVVVKRRLVRKMEFLNEYLADERNPTHEELKAWFEERVERFILPGKVSFRHLYFSPDLWKDKVKEAAVAIREKLEGSPVELPKGAILGDPFMFEDYYADQSAEEVTTVFGSKFAEAIFQLNPVSWQGPIESELGWHLVWVTAVKPVRVPAIGDVEEQIKEEWLEERRAEAQRAAYQAMRVRYEIVLPENAGDNAITSEGRISNHHEP